jgi:Uma2 family endonuclease
MALVLPACGPLTWDDIQRFPDDSYRYELIEGGLIVTPAPTGPHQIVVLALYRALHGARPPGLAVHVAPFDFRPTEGTCLEPDVLVVPDAVARSAYAVDPPFLVVEVLSPSTRAVDLGAKRLAYQELGVPAYWIVDADEPMLTVLELDAAGKYQEVARVAGDAAFTATRPYAVTVVPTELMEL